MCRLGNTEGGDPVLFREIGVFFPSILGKLLMKTLNICSLLALLKFFLAEKKISWCDGEFYMLTLTELSDAQRAAKTLFLGVSKRYFCRRLAFESVD